MSEHIGSRYHITVHYLDGSHTTFRERLGIALEIAERVAVALCDDDATVDHVDIIDCAGNIELTHRRIEE
jgi:hypothetical protein